MESDLKIRIKHMIDDYSEDESFLEQVYQILDAKSKASNEITRELNQEHLIRLEESIRQVQEGKVYTDIEAKLLFQNG